MCLPSRSAPLLRLVLVLVVLVLAMAAGIVASSDHTGWLFLGFAFAAAPVAAVVDGRARNLHADAPRPSRPAVPRVTRATRVAPV